MQLGVKISVHLLRKVRAELWSVVHALFLIMMLIIQVHFPCKNLLSRASTHKYTLPCAYCIFTKALKICLTRNSNFRGIVNHYFGLGYVRQIMPMIASSRSFFTSFDWGNLEKTKILIFLPLCQRCERVENTCPLILSHHSQIHFQGTAPWSGTHGTAQIFHVALLCSHLEDVVFIWLASSWSWSPIIRDPNSCFTEPALMDSQVWYFLWLNWKL